ncbi:MAG: hypothetical protein PHO37_18400 [Kiritimatiellae bacterium]|nr:hypothetical protein [Kiritimatiellia bacterium]
MVILIIFFTLIVSCFIWHASRGVVRNLECIEAALNELLRRGYDCGFLVIKVSYSTKFVQIRKYITCPGKYGIQLAFPNARWSKKYFPRIIQICNSYDTNRCRIDYTGELEFLYFDFGKDLKQASQCVKQILVDAFSVTCKTKLFIKLENAALWDELIESPDTHNTESTQETLLKSWNLIKKSKNKREK